MRALSRSLATAILLNSLVSASPADDYKAGPTHPRLSVQAGHTAEVQAVAFSSDGRLLLSGGRNGTACLFEVETGAQIHRLDAGAHTSITDVAFGPGARQALTVTESGRLATWDLEAGRPVRPIELRGSGFRLSPDSRLALGEVYRRDKDGKDEGRWSVLFDILTGEETDTFKAESGREMIGLSPDGERYVSSGLEVRSIADGSLVRKLEAPALIQRLGGTLWAYSGRAAFSPDGRSIAVVGVSIHFEDKEARIISDQIATFDVSTGKCTRLMSPAAEEDARGLGRLESVAFAPDGRTFATAGIGFHVQLWDAETGEERLQIKEAGRGATFALAFSPDGSRLATGGWDGALALRDARTGEMIRRLEGPRNHPTFAVTSLASAGDGDILAIGSRDELVRVWSLRAGRQLAVLEGHKGGVNSVDVSSDGRRVVSGGRDSVARLWDLRSRREVFRWPVEPGMDGIPKVQFSSDGRLVLIVGQRIEIRDATTGEAVGSFDPGRMVHLFTASFAYNGRFVIGAGRIDFFVPLAWIGAWEISTGRQVLDRQWEDDNVFTVSYSERAKMILTGGTDGRAKLIRHDATKPGIIRMMGEFKAPDTANSVKAGFSPDGTRILTAADGDGRVAIWETATGREVRELAPAGVPYTAAAFSGDGRLALAGRDDGVVVAWDATTGVERARLIVMPEGRWAVVAPGGRFDAKDIEDVEGLAWVMSDDPLRPLPVEVFLRDYYEPRLLGRLLAGENFPTVRDLGELNRVRPLVAIKAVEPQPGRDDEVTVTVEVAGQSGTSDASPNSSKRSNPAGAAPSAAGWSHWLGSRPGGSPSSPGFSTSRSAEAIRSSFEPESRPTVRHRVGEWANPRSIKVATIPIPEHGVAPDSGRESR